MAGISGAPTAQWSSRFAFIMAAVGSSVGLGNLWRFSKEAGESGGGAFIFIYLACVLLIGIPVLICEFVIGRAGNAPSAVGSVKDVAMRSGASKNWAALAWIGQIASFLIVSFYCVVAAWVMIYIPEFLKGTFTGLSSSEIGDVFKDAQSNTKRLLIYFSVFALLTTVLVARGVNKGIEFTAKLLMPIFFLLLIGLAIFALTANFKSLASDPSLVNPNGASDAIAFLFTWKASDVTSETVVRALGQAFFSIGLGSAIMITYGSYLPRNVNIPKSAVFIGITDTCVALIAGLAIFPIVYAFGVVPVEEGNYANLFFVSIPLAMEQIPGGMYVGAAFFFLAIFAAITSSVSLLEPTTAYVSEKFQWTKAKAAWLMGGLMWFVGLGSIFIGGFMGLLDEKLTGAIMLPLCGLLAVLFVGWKMNRELLDAELDVSPFTRSVILFLVKFVAPLCVAAVLVYKVATKIF